MKLYVYKYVHIYVRMYTRMACICVRRYVSIRKCIFLKLIIDSGGKFKRNFQWIDVCRRELFVFP